MNPIGDGRKHNGDVGVAERDTVDPKEMPFAHVSFDDAVLFPSAIPSVRYAALPCLSPFHHVSPC
ncbi:MAG: hypothetical protein ACREA2_22750 [Blastocatellia bacterium]